MSLTASPDLCFTHVSKPQMFMGGQCTRKPQVVIDGKGYCSIHKPGGVKDRNRAARRERDKASTAVFRYRSDTELWRAACVDLVERYAKADFCAGTIQYHDEADDLLAKKPKPPPGAQP